jgi:hypothetical protein
LLEKETLLEKELVEMTGDLKRLDDAGFRAAAA